ncbi:MAG: N-acetylneuraminate synthase family protein [Verrucomicrobiota bacterium]
MTAKIHHTFSIGRHSIGAGAPCLITAEVAQAHDGDLAVAHDYIDAAAEAGADVVKFQTHIAAAESTPHEPWRVTFSKDKSRYDYWKRMEFSRDQWQELFDHAKERDLEFMSSPFSAEAVELLDDLGVPAWKIGAGETTTTPLLERLADTDKPVLLSTGMSTLEEGRQAVELIRGRGVPVGVYQCTSAYPCPPEKLGLNMIQSLRDLYECPVGLSDHSGVIYAGLAAAALTCDMIEVHLTLERDTGLPDEPASLLPAELKQLVDGVRFIETALHHDVDKNAMAEELGEMRRLFTKSLVAVADLDAGTRLTRDVVGIKKPGFGIPSHRLEEFLDRTLKEPVTVNTLLMEEHFE